MKRWKDLVDGMKLQTGAGCLFHAHYWPTEKRIEYAEIIAMASLMLETIRSETGALTQIWNRFALLLQIRRNT
jgi:hypothetical protein